MIVWRSGWRGCSDMWSSRTKLEMAGQLDRLKAELTRLRQRAETAPAGGEGERNAAEERPPHY